MPACLREFCAGAESFVFSRGGTKLRNDVVVFINYPSAINNVIARNTPISTRVQGKKWFAGSICSFVWIVFYIFNLKLTVELGGQRWNSLFFIFEK